MLIDDLLNNAEWKKAGVLDTLRAPMEQAHKFILQRDFAMAIDEMTHNNWAKQADKLVPLCRLPYRNCWMEVAQTDRLAYRKYMATRPQDYVVKRIGWLMNQIDDTGQWSVEMFWSFDDRHPKFQEEVAQAYGTDYWTNAPYSAAITSLTFNPKAKTAVEAFVPWGPSKYSWNLATKRNIPGKYFDFRGTMTDWEGEGSFLMATLAMLNSKNVVEYTPVSFKKKNKGSTRPLYDHHIVSIHQRYTKRNMHPSTSSDGHKFRQHFCRAHFKIRRTGVFFWSAHRRGDPSLGIITKDYEMRL